MRGTIDEFIEYLEGKKKRSNNTLYAYKKDLSDMLSYVEECGVDSVEKITSTNINSYILYMEKIGKSPATITRALSSMKTYFHFMLIRGMISSEPTELITPPQINHNHIVRNSEETIEKLLKLPKGDEPMALRDKAMLMLISGTNIRVAELLDITVDDVNTRLGYIICRNTKKDKTITIDKNIKSAIDRYMNKGRGKLVSDGKCEYLFVNCHGGHMSRQGFWKLLKEYGEKGGIKDGISPETLRKK